MRIDLADRRAGLTGAAMDLSLVPIACGLVLLFAGLYPFGPYQLSLMLARRSCAFPPAPRAVAEDSKRGPETFAICLCAYNEERVIRHKVEDLLGLRAASRGGLEILIYVDAARDRTADILREYADRITLVVSPDRRGKNSRNEPARRQDERHDRDVHGR